VDNIDTQKIKFAWDFIYSCNYRCPYCWFYGKWASMENNGRTLSVEELTSPWKKIYDKYGSVHINMLGGEPFLYFQFKELIQQLSGMHSLEIVTNLSCNIDDFVEEVNFERVRLKPTFHPLFADFDAFLKKMLVLKRKQQNTPIFYLGYPPQIGLLKHFQQKFAEHDIKLEALSFWGEYAGVKYPQGYTPEERDLLDSCMATRNGEKFQLEPKQVKDKLCNAGHLSAVVHPDGKAFRCGGQNAQPIGNIFNDDFNLLAAPLACNSDYCPCNEWASFLVDNNASGETQAAASSAKIILSETEIVAPKQSIDRKAIAPNYVFVTWDMHYGCNYNCSYCNTPKPWHKPGSWERDRDKVVYPGVDQWIRIWEDIYKRYGSCEIHITGGEPFIYPGFMELIGHLSKIHTLEIITNLFWNPDYFVKNFSPERVRIGTSFHPEFADLDDFLKKHLLLREHGFETWANYVAHPLQMEKMKEYWARFKELKISFNIQPYLGWYEGREYPAGYTDAELKNLRGCYDNEDIVNQKTIEWKTGSAKRNMRGRPCRMGQMYAKVYPLGDAYRCCAQDTAKIGNLIDGSFNLTEDPLPCDSPHCHCWRCMLAGEENGWAQHWVIPHKINK
jgi:organic radical activating enzyme